MVIADGKICGKCERMLRELIREKNEQKESKIEEYSGDYSSVLTADEVFVISPKPLEVDIKRAKELKTG